MKKEIRDNMKQQQRDIVNFEDYAPLRRDYTEKELVEIYKQIIADINKKDKC